MGMRRRGRANGPEYKHSAANTSATARQTRPILRTSGGAGTAELPWSGIPGSDGTPKVRFGIQFSGTEVRLPSFTKAF